MVRRIGKPPLHGPGVALWPIATSWVVVGMTAEDRNGSPAHVRSLSTLAVVVTVERRGTSRAIRRHCLGSNFSRWCMEMQHGDMNVAAPLHPDPII